MNIGSYWQSKVYKSYRLDPDGTGKAEIYAARGGIVELFTFKGGGDPHHDAFTSLEMYFNGHVWHCRLDRHYHPRWWRRLAEQFAFDVCAMAEG
jgi:hypothetical protein